jgi:hypothetical protein
MPEVKLDLPASVMARFLAEIAPIDRNSFATCALIEALDRRQFMKKSQRAKPGPKAEVEKESIGVYLPTDLADWLRGMMKGPRDLSNVVTNLLQRARAAGWKAYDTDDGG